MSFRRNIRGGFRRGKSVIAEAAPFSPLDLPDLEAWYRETYAAGTWSDLSGNGRDLTQATAANRPTQTTRAGQLALSFDGGDWLQGAFGSALTQPTTVYIVAETAAAGYFFDGDGASNRNLFQRGATPNYLINAGASVSGGTPGNTIFGGCAIYSGNPSLLYVDDFRAAQHLLSGSAGTAVLDGLTIGADYTGGTRLTGYVWEIAVYTGSHDAATRKLIGDYFTARYAGLTVTT